MDPLQPGAEKAKSLTLTGLDHLVISVSDLKVSAEWYQRVLGVAPVAPAEPGKLPTTFQFASQALRLRPVAVSQQEWFTARQAAPGGEDLCFLTKATPEDVIAHLTACGVAVEVGPVKKSGARGPINSVYCRDPDGSLIEIASYPPA